MTPLNDFLDGEKTIGGLVFRPFTIGSKAICEQLGLSLFVTGDGADAPGEADRQIAAFAWLHAAPLPEVLKAIREKRAEEAALEFSFSLNLKSLNAIVAEINRISKQASENSVEIEPTAGESSASGNSVGQTG